MKSAEREPTINPYYERLNLILGDKQTYQTSGGYRETLHIVRMPDGKIIVEFLRPDNTHTVFFVTEGAVSSEKKQIFFVGGESRKKENLKPDVTLDEALERFNLE